MYKSPLLVNRFKLLVSISGELGEGAGAVVGRSVRGRAEALGS